MTKCVLLISGGVDSSILLLALAYREIEVYPLFVDMGHCASQAEALAVDAVSSYVREYYGHVNKVEMLVLHRFRKTSDGWMNKGYPFFTPFDDGSLKEGVPSGYVPGRNTLLVSAAYEYACFAKASHIAIGTNNADCETFPDCSVGWAKAMSSVLNANNIALNFDISLFNPFVGILRKDIEEAAKTCLPMGITMSCYYPDFLGKPCGECYSCKK